MEYEVMGYATIRAQVRTLGDLRELIAQADKWVLRDECNIDWDYGCVFIDVADTNRGDSMEPISCGDHYPVKDANGEYFDHADFVITAHECARDEPEPKPSYQGPENYEEALEMALDSEPPTYDWPTRDRLRRERSQAEWLGNDLV